MKFAIILMIYFKSENCAPDYNKDQKICGWTQFADLQEKLIKNIIYTLFILL